MLPPGSGIDVHVVPPEERTRVYSRDSLFLDVGAKDEAEVAAMGIGPGDPVVPDAPFTVMNGTDNYLAQWQQGAKAKAKEKSD